MGTVNRTIESDNDKKMALRLVEARPIPFTLSIADGKHRSTAQNKLQHMWMGEIAQQKGDMTAEEARGYCKLTIGVPILRSQNAAFAKEYDAVVKPLPYEAKLRLMMVPFDFGVTRLMTTKQKTQYLDDIARHFGEQGIILTMPEDLRNEITNTHPGDALPSASAGDNESGTNNASSEPSDQTVSPDPAQTEEEPADNPDAPTAAAGSPSLFTPSVDENELQHLIDFARKGLDAASDGNDAAARLAFIESMRLNYRDAVESKDGRNCIDAINKALTAVCNGKRSREQAQDYIARDILACDYDDLGGRRNG